MATGLEQLKQFTTIVADTGDFGQLEKFKPQDSTTNPSLILASSQNEAYKHLIEDAVKYGKENGSNIDEQVEKAIDKLFVNFGLEILKIIPGRVSTEIDARLSFDTEGTVKKAKELAALYQAAGINTKERLLLKIASTWEGLQAAKILESEGYPINMTLLFNIHQAAVAAENGITLISPFAGRITDFFKAKEGRKDNYPANEDPGVRSVQNIYNYMRKYDYKTVVMGASFRNKEQVLELAGCDLLTVSPQLLGELKDLQDFTVAKKLSVEDAKKSDIPKITDDEKAFRWAMNEDEMASSKLEEGIRKFAADTVKLETEIKKKIQQ